MALSKRSGAGSLPVRGSALTSGDSLSDTKIFILLAAIVFVFLAALGVAMARVSRNRRRNYTDNARNHVVAAQRPPETLNKTILDLLPVFEVTEKHRLRQLRSQSPREAMFRECFVDNGSEYSLQIMPSACHGESSTPIPPGLAKTQIIQSGGYGLDSHAISQRSLSIEGSHRYSDDYMHYCNRIPGTIPEEGCSSQGASNCAEWQYGGILKNTSPSAAPHFALDTPSPVAIRYYRSTPSQDATPSCPTRCPSAGVHWDDMALGYSHGGGGYPNKGTVFYQERGSRSLDLSSPERASMVPSNHLQRKSKSPAWNACRSQPEIARKHSRSLSMTASDCENGIGSCPICLEEFEIGEQLRELPCFHRYHVICIDTWLISRSTCCPYCKFDIRRWYYGSVSEDGIMHPGPVEHQGLPLHFHDQEILGSSDSSGLAAQEPGERRHRRRNGSRIHRRQRVWRRPASRGRFNGLWQLLRAVMTSDIHYTESMRPG
ncbi:hypothetical protein LPJ81_000910 [Coemansia sp. IMI 209127]|nr:hypothetical protein LPJ81_000910 [Coemansia sp. IMI 209127]